jgi:uncharacterized RDD family membrane protein YckC
MDQPLLPPAPARYSGIPSPRPAYDDLAAPAGPPVGAWPPPVAPAPVPYAHWWRRVVATVIDTLLAIPFWVAGVIGLTLFLENATVLRDPTTNEIGGLLDLRATTTGWVGAGLAIAAYAGLIAFGLWNQVVRQGRRGASIGKACVYLVVVHDRNGKPIGVLATFVRAVAHLLDGVFFYLGYLWPLVDRRRQTFADKLMGTVVLHLPPLPQPEPVHDAELPYGW